MSNIHRLFVNLIILAGAQFFSIQSAYAASDFIIFSYDRPMQLYALLESTEHYLKGIATTCVIYRTSDNQFEQGYEIVKHRFVDAHFIAQGSDPKADFKPLFIQALRNCSSAYILFAPDDIIVKNYADLEICTQKMEESGAYGFFLRLGTHLDMCYSMNQPQPLPPLTDLGNTILCWTFNSGSLDWNYPNNVDMTIYRRNDIVQTLETSHYTSPNKMESAWAKNNGSVSNKKGLCFRDSIIVNIPVNCVQKDYANNQMNSWTPRQLLDMFKAGKKIDISQLKGIKNQSCHINYDLAFVER
jgi:hypothetical protein